MDDFTVKLDSSPESRVQTLAASLQILLGEINMFCAQLDPSCWETCQDSRLDVVQVLALARLGVLAISALSLSSRRGQTVDVMRAAHRARYNVCQPSCKKENEVNSIDSARHTFRRHDTPRHDTTGPPDDPGTDFNAWEMLAGVDRLLGTCIQIKTPERPIAFVFWNSDILAWAPSHE